jgi:hypothetical protein
MPNSPTLERIRAELAPHESWLTGQGIGVLDAIPSGIILDTSRCAAPSFYTRETPLILYAEGLNTGWLLVTDGGLYARRDPLGSIMYPQWVPWLSISTIEIAFGVLEHKLIVNGMPLTSLTMTKSAVLRLCGILGQIRQMVPEVCISGNASFAFPNACAGCLAERPGRRIQVFSEDIPERIAGGGLLEDAATKTIIAAAGIVLGSLTGVAIWPLGRKYREPSTLGCYLVPVCDQCATARVPPISIRESENKAIVRFKQNAYAEMFAGGDNGEKASSNLQPIAISPARKETYETVWGKRLQDLDAIIIDAWMEGCAALFHTFPKIPKTKLNRARKSYWNTEPQDTVIAMHDTGTFFASGQGFVLTLTALHWKFGRNCGCIQLREFRGIVSAQVAGPSPGIYIGDWKVDSQVGRGHSSRLELVAFLRYVTVIGKSRGDSTFHDGVLVPS